MTGKKILFISANQHCVPYPVYPLGISYLVSYLKEKMPEMQSIVLDVNLHSEEEMRSAIVDSNPDFIAISFRNVDDANSMNKESFIDDYRKLVNMVRETSNGKVIIGGAGFSIFPEHFFTELNPDFGIKGEGEESIYQLIKGLNDGSPVESIEGLVHRVDSDIVVNERKRFTRELSVDFPEHMIDYYWQQSGMLNIQTKRGCPYNCIYCSYPVIEGSVVRTLDAKKTVDSLVDLYNKHKINYVFFTDSVFNLSKEFNYSFANYLIDSGIKMKWGAYFAPKGLDVQTLKLYKEAGLKHIEFGTESLSDQTLKKYNKQFTVSEVLEISENCNEAGVYFAHFMILAGYGETNATVEETFRNSAKIRNSVFFPFIGMRIYPHTELQKIAIREGLLEENDALLQPKYYISDKVDIESLRGKAKGSGAKWIWPDEDLPEVIKLMRKKNRKGPLWHLIR